MSLFWLVLMRGIVPSPSRGRTAELTPGRREGTHLPVSPQILYYTSGQLYPTGSKAERASLLQNPPTGGVATLKLADVRSSDTGTYLCQVNNPPDFYTNGLGLINLTVLGKADHGPTKYPRTSSITPRHTTALGGCVWDPTHIF